MSTNHMDNPFLEAVPVQLDKQVFFQRIYGRPVIPKGPSQANAQERQRWLSHLTELFIPMEYHYAIYDVLLRAHCIAIPACSTWDLVALCIAVAIR